MPRKVSHNDENAVVSSVPVNGPSLNQSPELDLERFRIDQDYAAHIQTKKTAVSHRRPDFVDRGKAWRALEIRFRRSVNNFQTALRGWNH